MNLPQKIYTEKEVTRAKNTAQIVGWAQGAGTVVVAAIAWRLLGWIPVLLVLFQNSAEDQAARLA